MPMLSRKDQGFLREHLGHSLKDPVTLKLFTQTFECQFCRETKQLLTEVAELSDKITLEVLNFVVDKEQAEALDIKRIPGLAIVGARDYGIRFYGIPSGYEFNSLVEDIVAVSNDAHGLEPETLEMLARLQTPVHLQVFVTPTCPYCPMAVRTAHALAMASDLVTADMVESVEFPQLANRYGVMGVPRTIVNETVNFEGAAPESLVMAKVLEAAGVVTSEEVQALFDSFQGELETT